MKTKNRLLFSSLITVAFASQLHAAPQTWTTGDGGSGLWSNTANWGGATFASGDTAIFGATSGTTTLNNDLVTTTQVASFTFNANAPAYTIGGAAFAPTSGGTAFIVNSASGVTQTINNNFTLHQNAVSITGSGDLTLGGTITKGGTWNPYLQMDGTGVLTLNGAGSMNSLGSTNAYQFNAGTVVLAKSTSGGFNPAGVVMNGSTVKLGAAEQFKNAGRFTLNGGTLDLNGWDAASVNVNGSVTSGTTAGFTVLTGSGGRITNNAAGSGTNWVVLGNTGNNQNNLHFQYGGTITDGATAKVGVTVVNSGNPGTFAVLTGNNTYSGGTNINNTYAAAGGRQVTVSIGSVANIGRKVNFIGSAGTPDVALQLTGTAVTNSNQFDSMTAASGKGFAIDVADPTNTFTFGKNASGADLVVSNGSFQKLGAGTMVITSASFAPSSPLILSGGTLKVDYQGGGSISNVANTFSGGSLYLLGKTSGTTSQSLTTVTLNAGGGSLLVNPNNGTATNLTLGTLTTFNAGSSLLIGTAAGAGTGTVTITTTTNKDATGIIGGGRVVFTTDGGTTVDWATTASGGSPYTLSGYTGYTVGLPASGATSTVNYSHTGAGSVTTSESVNTLKLASSGAGQSLFLDSVGDGSGTGQTLTLTTGGLLFAGANDYSITSGTLKSNTSTNSDLIIHQYGAGALTIGSVIDNGVGTSTLTKAGPGTLVLNGANTYTGQTYVTGGILSISSDSNIGGSNGTFANLTSLTSSASVTYTGSLPAGFGVGSTMLGRTVNAINTGTSTITLSGNANTALGGGTASWVNGVTLALNNGGVLQANGTFSFTGSNSGGATPATTVNRPVTIGSGGGGFDVTTGNTLTVPGTLTATGMVTKSGLGTLVLGASNYITGGFTINEGTVQQSGDNSLSDTANSGFATNVAASNLILGGGTAPKFQLNNFNANVTSLVSSNIAAIVENGSATAGTKTLTVSNGADNTFAGILQNGAAGKLALAKSGGGTLTLSNAGNTFNGGITISNGQIASTVAGALGSTSGALTMAGGMFDLNAQSSPSQTFGAVSITIAPVSGNTIQNGTLTGTSFAASNPSGTATVTSILAGTSAALTKSSTGTLTLSGANTYGGLTTVSGGLIQLNVAETAGTSGPLGKPTTPLNSIALQGGGLQFTANNTYDYTTSGRIKLVDASTGTIDTNGQNVTFATAFGVGTNKTGALIKAGAGTLTLSAANTYTGATTVSVGTLALVGGSQASPITISSGAALGFTLGSSITSTSTVTFSGATAKVTVTGTPLAATLMTATSITGVPVLDPAIPGYVLAIEDTGTTLKLKAAAADNYATWATTNGVTGQAANLDHDNDGVSNGVEYFLVGPNTVSTGFNALPGVVTVGGTRSVTWPRASTYTGTYTTDFVVETSDTLAEGSWSAAPLGAVSEPDKVNINVNDVTYTFPAGPVKKFARLRVTGP